MKKMTALLVAVTGLTAGCAATTNVTGETAPPPPITYDVTVPHGQTVPNVIPPQQLHITFPDNGEAFLMWAYRECEDMSGTMGPSDPGEYTCWNVDY